MKLGSLFDGSGTAPLAAAMCGIEPVWASEIEAYPIKVTTARFPNMKHLGDITKINGAEVEPVDVLCGGSPCQDLSVAGKQKGLQDGERSHLFFEMTRIIKEMRAATDGKYPRYIIWENVPGAFSSNNGRDFHAVLQAFAKIADPNVHVPEPPRKGKTDRLAWRYAGSIVGDGWSIAWRTVDAQYWGVPQRRRRIYLVADFASECAGEILFEHKSLPGDTESSRTPREETAADAGRSLDGSSGAVSCNRKQLGLDVGFDVASTLLANDYKEPQCVVFEPKSMLAENWAAQEIKNALRAGESKSAHVCVCLNDQGGSVMSVSEDVTATLRAQEHGHQPIVCTFMGGQGAKARSIAYCDDGTTPTLKSAPSGSNTVPDVVYVLQANGIDRADTAGCNGAGFRENESYTLNTIDRHAVVYTADCRNGALNEELSGTLQAKPNGSYSLNFINPVVFESNGFAKYSEGFGALRASGGDCGPGSENLCVYPTVTDPLMANSHPGSYTGQDAFSDMLPVVPSNKPPRKYIVRRLTPLECCRLQGFPDWWEDGVDGSDSARYKMWGNGMALPNMLHVMRGIARVEGER